LFTQVCRRTRIFASAVVLDNVDMIELETKVLDWLLIHFTGNILKFPIA
jgi:hypothetical protein